MPIYVPISSQQTSIEPLEGKRGDVEMRLLLIFQLTIVRRGDKNMDHDQNGSH